MTKLLQPAKRVERLETELHEARMPLRRDPREAHESGVSQSELARQLGVSMTRVKQLLDSSADKALT